MNTYRELLGNLRDHLRFYDVPSWPQRLDGWISELDTPQSLDVKTHLLRTRKALGGMGSMGDIVICAEAGHKIPQDEGSANRANDTLLSLVGKLHAEVTLQLAHLTN